MTEPERRFPTSDDAIDYVLKHNLSSADAEVIFQESDFDSDEALRVVERVRRAEKQKAERDARSAALGRQVKKRDFAKELEAARAKAAPETVEPSICPPLQPTEVPQPEAVVEDGMARLKRSGMAKLRGEPAVERLTPKGAEQAKVGALEGEVEGKGVEDNRPDWVRADWDETVETASASASAGERSDEAEEKQQPKAKVSEESEKALILELVKVFKSDTSTERLRYNTQKAEVADLLGYKPMDVHRAVKKEVDDERQPTLTQSEKALMLVRSYRLWCDPTDQAEYVSINVNGHWEHYPIESKEFKSLIRAEYSGKYWKVINGERFEGAIGDPALNEMIATAKAKARASKNEAFAVMRVGGNGGKVWVDLAQKDWTIMRTTAQGWNTFGSGDVQVPFIRKRGMQPMPVPVRGANIRELRKFLNVKKDGFVLSVRSLLGTYQPEGPYSIGFYTGVPGAGKTTALRVLLGLSDPNTADVGSIGKVDDIYVAAYNQRVLCFDNISKITQEQSDVLCRISTGTGYTKRALRTDAEQFMMSVCRPIFLGGIPLDLVDKSDLADRSIVCELAAMDEDTQIGPEEFWQDFREAQPRLLGAVLDGVVGALRDAKAVSLNGYGRVRMMDFARWAEAGCRALGFEEGEFLSAYVANQERAMHILFREDPVAQAIALYIEQNPQGWRGNVERLLPELVKSVRKARRSDLVQDRQWPKAANWLGRKLRRIDLVLRKVAGIEIKFEIDLRATHEGDNGGIEIRKRP